jgi:hypothetical protein
MATVYIFNGTQSGTADGSYSDPYDLSNITTAESDAGSGGIVIFKDGAYTGTSLTFADGSLNYPLTYKAENANDVTITMSTKFTFGNTSLASNLTYQDLKFVNSATSIGDRVVFRQLSTDTSIRHFADRCTYESFVFGTYFAPASDQERLRLTNCVYKHTGSSHWMGHLSDATAQDLELIGCTIYSSGTGTSIFNRYNVTLKNTIIFDPNNTITTWQSNGSTTITGACDLVRADGTDLKADANNIAQDPQFVDAANGDVRLRPSSPCIGAGTAS